jgi:hypothetical protein
MRVLLVGSAGASVARADEHLRGAGFEVERCHAPGAPAFPCAGLESGTCPLEQEPVDVVVAARDHSAPRPTLAEDGVTCALRRSIPLVVAGRGPNPYEAWTSESVDDLSGLVPACERVVTQPLPRHSEVATASLVGGLERTDGISEQDARDAVATVWREHGRLRVALRAPRLAAREQSSLVAKIAGDLRAFDPYAPTIDIAWEKS